MLTSKTNWVLAATLAMGSVAYGEPAAAPTTNPSVTPVAVTNAPTTQPVSQLDERAIRENFYAALKRMAPWLSNWTSDEKTNTEVAGEAAE